MTKRIHQGESASNDLDRVADAARVKAAEREAADQTMAERATNESRIDKLIADEAQARLLVFSEAVRTKARVYVSRNADSLSVAVSSYAPWVGRPFKQFGIVRAYGQRAFRVTDQLAENDPILKSEATLDEVIALLTDQCAELIAAGEQFEYSLPLWYLKTGAVLGWLLFAATWLLACTGGLVGVFLGWIPALLVYKLAQYLWLPAIGLLIWASESVMW